MELYLEIISTLLNKLVTFEPYLYLVSLLVLWFISNLFRYFWHKV